MSKLELSNKYMWSTKDTLGAGATAQVFAGYSRETGEKVAIKVFSGRSYNFDYASRKREIDVIKQLSDHENIVKLLAVEEQRTNKQTIIVMELCTGGNLYEVIDAPENAYGLSEHEFLRVVIDVANGMQFLHSKNIVHRDVKPGNIMRFHKPDGSICFKLTDFGASRELQQGEEFMSYYGTEEYLHPEMYERALINPQMRKTFSAKVDLWSIGATFYQAATGRLPFQSYMRRADKLKMFEIISRKPSGVIAGWQRTPNGPIEYSDQLPEDTRISLGLKLLITPILAGLLENNPSKMMGFDEFFFRISRIAKMKVIDVFVVCQSWYYKVYIDPEASNDSYEMLKGAIKEQTSIPQSQMELFFDNHPFIPSSCLAKDLPVTTEDRPVFLYGGAPYEAIHLLSPPLPEIEQPPAKNCHLDQDAVYAKTCTQIAFQYKYGAERLERLFRLMQQAASGMKHAIDQKGKDITAIVESTKKSQYAICGQLLGQVHCLKDVSELLKSIDILQQGALYNERLQLSSDIKSEIANKEQQLNKTMDELKAPLDKASSYIAEIDQHKAWDTSYHSEAFSKSVETTTSYMRSIKDIFNSFMRDRRKQPMIDFDKKVHEFAKGKVNHQLFMANRKVKELVTKRGEAYERLQHWLHSQVVPMRHDLCQLQKHLQRQQEKYDSDLSRMNDWNAQQSNRMKRVGELISHASTSTGRTSVSPALAAATAPPQTIPKEIDHYLQQLSEITNQNVNIAESCFKKLERLSSST